MEGAVEDGGSTEEDPVLTNDGCMPRIAPAATGQQSTCDVEDRVVSARDAPVQEAEVCQRFGLLERLACLLEVVRGLDHATSTDSAISWP